MNIINAENITKSYTERKLFDKASFYLQEGEKVGVHRCPLFTAKSGL